MKKSSYVKLSLFIVMAGVVWALLADRANAAWDCCGRSGCNAASQVNCPSVYQTAQCPDGTCCAPGGAGGGGGGNGGPGGCGCVAWKTQGGMLEWSVSEPFIILQLHDKPLWYDPPIGPKVSFELFCRQMVK